MVIRTGFEQGPREDCHQQLQSPALPTELSNEND